jgi:hypothetical protein
MYENTKTKLCCTIWWRGLYILLFAILWGFGKWLLVGIAVLQFASVLFKGELNPTLKSFGQSVSLYMYQIAQFVTFNSEERPFPFSSWPAGSD